MPRAIPTRERLIVALDFASVEEAQALVDRLGDSVVFYKIGLELAFAGGLDLARRLIGSGRKVFVDVKLHDIGVTVSRAAAQLARLGADFLTVHAYPQTMAAARDGVGDAGSKILAVTVLTSYNDVDLASAGYDQGVERLVARRALQAKAARMDGLVLSAEEAAAVRATVGPDMLLVTPGIRLASDPVGDQKRVMTPAKAIAAGADYLVVGRPVTRAANPTAVAGEIGAQIDAAVAAKGLTWTAWALI